MYYLYGVTNYVHVLVFYSCGRANGESKLSRNLVYVRDEFVSGPKDSEVTLSTLEDALHGRTEAA